MHTSCTLEVRDMHLVSVITDCRSKCTYVMIASVLFVSGTLGIMLSLYSGSIICFSSSHVPVRRDRL